MPPSSRCGSGTRKMPPFLAPATTAEKHMPACISAVGLSLRVHPRDPTTLVLRQAEAQETQRWLSSTAKLFQDLFRVSFARGFLLVGVTDENRIATGDREVLFRRPRRTRACRPDVSSAMEAVWLPSTESEVPSDHVATGTIKTVIRSGPSSSARIGEPGRFAPQAAASPGGRKNIRCGCQRPSRSLK